MKYTILVPQQMCPDCQLPACYEWMNEWGESLWHCIVCNYEVPCRPAPGPGRSAP
jgi:hypothetical protein